MEQDSNHSGLCKMGCGFFGNNSFEGMCSKCYKDYVKRTQQSSPSAGRSSPGNGKIFFQFLFSTLVHSKKCITVEGRDRNNWPVITLEECFHHSFRLNGLKLWSKRVMTGQLFQPLERAVRIFEFSFVKDNYDDKKYVVNLHTQINYSNWMSF